MVLRLQSVRRARENERAPLPSVLDVMRLRGFMHASRVCQAKGSCYPALATRAAQAQRVYGKKSYVDSSRRRSGGLGPR